MASVISRMSISLDGFISGPEDLDPGFFRVQQWAGDAMAWRESHGLEGGQDNEDSAFIDEMDKGTGAYVMGRRMFNVGEEPWGEEPSFHAPVFVVTHYARDTLVRKGGTTFTFVTSGIGGAIEQALAAADGQNVQVSGGANLLQQVIKAGLLDELHLHVAPVLLGDGIRLFERDTHDHIELDAGDVLGSPAGTHMHFKFKK